MLCFLQSNISELLQTFWGTFLCTWKNTIFQTAKRTQKNVERWEMIKAHFLLFFSKRSALVLKASAATWPGCLQVPVPSAHPLQCIKSLDFCYVNINFLSPLLDSQIVDAIGRPHSNDLQIVFSITINIFWPEIYHYPVFSKCMEIKRDCR